MRRPTRRLALSLLGVLWLAALLLFFFGARRKLEAAGAEGHTPEVSKGRRGRDAAGGQGAPPPGEELPGGFRNPPPRRAPLKVLHRLCACRGGSGPFLTPPDPVINPPGRGAPLCTALGTGSPSRPPALF